MAINLILRHEKLTTLEKQSQNEIENLNKAQEAHAQEESECAANTWYQIDEI